MEVATAALPMSLHGAATADLKVASHEADMPISNEEGGDPLWGTPILCLFARPLPIRLSMVLFESYQSIRSGRKALSLGYLEGLGGVEASQQRADELDDAVDNYCHCVDEFLAAGR